MNQIAHYEGNPCFASWDHFEHCYPRVSQLISRPYYSGCKLWTYYNFLSPYWFSLRAKSSPLYLLKGYSVGILGNTLKNFICDGKMPWNFSNMAEVGAHMIQTTLIAMRVVRPHLENPSPSRYLEDLFLENRYSLGILPALQIYFFAKDHFDRLAALKSGNFILHKLAESNNKQAILYLLKEGARINQKDALGNTPLHRGASQGSFDAVLCLLKNGADIWAKNDQGETFLISAILENQTDLIDQLLLLDIEMPWKEALLFAIKVNNRKIVQSIESKKAV